MDGPEESVFIHSPVDGHSDCSQFGAITNDAANDGCLCVSLCGDRFCFSWVTGRSDGCMYRMTAISFIRSSQTVTQSDCTSLHSHP